MAKRPLNHSVHLSLTFLMAFAYMLVLVSCSNSPGGAENAADSNSNSNSNCSESSTNLTPWTKLIGFSEANTDVKAMTSDSCGNVYVTGQVNGLFINESLTDYNNLYVSKFDKTGSVVWTKQITTTNSDTLSYSIAVDTNGAIYVGGYTDDSTNNSLFLAKLDSNGDLVWRKDLFSGTELKQITGIKVDSTGNIYATGYTEEDIDSKPITGTDDLFVLKFDNDGNILASTLLGVTSKQTRANAIALSENYLYVAGQTRGDLDDVSKPGDDADAAAFIVKYDLSLNKIDRAILLGHFGGPTIAYAIEVDSNENIYIGGETRATIFQLGGIVDMFLAKYDASGTKIAFNNLGGSGGTTSTKSISIDSENNIYFVGITNVQIDEDPMTGVNDLFVMKYDSQFEFQWLHQTGLSSKSTYAKASTITSEGVLFIGGYTDGNLDDNTLSGIQDGFVKINNFNN